MFKSRVLRTTIYVTTVDYNLTTVPHLTLELVFQESLYDKPSKMLVPGGI